MSDVTTLEGDVVVGSGARFAIVSGRFNDFIVNQLEAGCIDALCRHGVTKSDITLARVPGAFEIPLTAKKLAQSNNFAAVITLGAVIRGSTPHFEYVCSTCASGVSQASLETHVPIVFGVLTTDTIEQAIERAGTKAGNKGADAAAVAIEMANLLAKL